MNREYSQEDSNFKHGEAEEQKISADDLKFMRSAVEKSYRQIKPETHLAVIWGLICMIIYISIHFLIKLQLFKWIVPLYLSLLAFGLCCTFATMFIIIKRQRKDGFAPQMVKQVAWIFGIIMFPIIFWDRMGLFNKIFCGSGFIYAMALGMHLGIIGTLHSKTWLLGGILIFVGMLLAFFIKDYSFIILGFSTGVGIIMPALIVERNYRKQKEENA
ncbi:MAG: hypothetical protein JXB29_07485 [Sedimentisphaerales bacterium]|nr:hypothetical protein [Sedimentisphaerales bacterium]